MKIKNKKKIIVSSTVLIFIAVFTTLLSSKTFSRGEYETKTIYICNGDTLWTIASMEQKSNKYYENKNIREIINDIKYINSLDSSYIYEGQKIVIPTI